MSFTKCQQCPTDECKSDYPEPPSNPYLIPLECGHQVHFHCYRNSFYKTHEETHNFCTECEESLQNTQVEDFFNPPDIGADVPELWNTDQEFQNNIHELFKSEKEYYKEKKKYFKVANKIQREYKKTIKIDLAHIQYQKKKAKQLLKTIPNKTSYKQKAKRYYTLFHKVIDDYGICINDLESNIPTNIPFYIDKDLMWREKSLNNPLLDLQLIPFKRYSFL